MEKVRLVDKQKIVKIIIRFKKNCKIDIKILK